MTFSTTVFLLNIFLSPFLVAAGGTTTSNVVVDRSLASGDYFIALAKNSTNVTFSEGRSSNEVKFKLNITDGDVDTLKQPIAVFAGLHCNGTKLESNVISATVDNSGIVVDGDYALVPVDVDVNTTDIEDFGTQYPGYFTQEDGKVTMQFCVMPELGTINVTKNNAVITTSSISFKNINFVVEIDMTKGFESASATVTEDEDAIEDNIQSTTIDNELSACECDDATKACIDEALIQPKTQNSAINICIFTNSTNDIILDSIKNMKIEDVSNNIAYAPITENAPNVLTTVSDTDTKNVIVNTRLISAFFSELDGGSATLDITGTAVLKFGNVRRLVSIRGGSKNKESSDLAGVRKLQNAGESDFGMSFEAVSTTASSTSGGSSMMKAVAMMLGVTGVVFV